MNAFRIAERTCLALGAAGLVFVGLAYLDAKLGAERAVAAFNRAAEAATLSPQPASLSASAPDQSQWSDKARADFAAARAGSGTPVALLRIPRLNVLVPVFMGTDKLTLNRGAGVVDGAARPGESGNVVLSAHRDSFFRPLKDIAVGDVIELQLLERTERYSVADIHVTDPLDLSVLEPTATPMLTLITCYPFYYVGFAPERYIVRATPVGPAPGDRIQPAGGSGH